MDERDYLLIVGKRIRTIRGEKNMRQFELASLCDFEKASMSRIEAGITNCSILTLLKISKALGVNIRVLFEDTYSS